jgi:hypothetical protein
VPRDGSVDDRKREAAAFMAHVVQETGALQFSPEISPPTDYCRPNDPAYPCVPGKTYIGCGPMQLSWNYKYGQVFQDFCTRLGVGGCNQNLACPAL